MMRSIYNGHHGFIKLARRGERIFGASPSPRPVAQSLINTRYLDSGKAVSLSQTSPRELPLYHRHLLTRGEILESQLLASWWAEKGMRASEHRRVSMLRNICRRSGEVNHYQTDVI